MEVFGSRGCKFGTVQTFDSVKLGPEFSTDIAIGFSCVVPSDVMTEAPGVID